MQHMQTTCKSYATNTTNAQNLGGSLRPPPTLFGPKCCAFVAFVAFVALLLHDVCMFACFAFVLHFIYILFASLLGMMRQLLRQWLLPRMLWMMLLLLLLLLLRNPLFSPVGVPCRGKIPHQNVHFIDVSVKLCKIV